ncbi:MAG: SDR family oxidoreductase [Bryobacteraceae bacterium]
MAHFLKDKCAVVTGGTRGIGRAIARDLMRAGASVAICGRTSDSVDATVADLSAFGSVFGEAADVSRWDQVERFFGTVGHRFGGLDILVNNAGVGVFRNLAEMTPEDWHRVIDLNLSGAFYCSRLAIPLMKVKGGGHIIHISSLAGRNAFPGGAAYNASKFGLNGFSEAMMQDLRYDNIRVSDIMPGSVATGFGSGSGEENWKIAPEDVAQVVVSLLRMPDRTLVSRVEMRPSRPPKPGR